MCGQRSEKSESPTHAFPTEVKQGCSASPFQFSQVSWGGGGGSFSTTLFAFLCFLLVTLLTTPKSGGGLVVSNSCDTMDCSPPGSSVLGLFQAGILEGVAISYSRGSSQPRDWTPVSHTAGKFFTVWTSKEAPASAEVSSSGVQREKTVRYLMQKAQESDNFVSDNSVSP